jgi:hypothetical protein
MDFNLDLMEALNRVTLESGDQLPGEAILL